MQEPIVFKIIIIGQQGVGKSSVVNRYTKGQFSAKYNVTVGVQFYSKMVKVDEKNTVKLQIWDTAGQEAFRSIVRSFYRGIAGVFFVYSIDNEQSFQGLRNWCQEVKQNAHEEVVYFLVASRADLEAQRKIQVEKASEFLKQIGGIFFIQTSAKSGLNIEQLFNRTAKIMYKKYISNGNFRSLVRPAVASGFQPERAQSFLLNQNRMSLQKKTKKKCC